MPGEYYRDLASMIANCLQPDRIWYAKRLSGNDTLATGAHQAGPYLPKRLAFSVFPIMNSLPVLLNPEARLRVVVHSHKQSSNARAIYYNNKIAAGGTRNEVRMTNFGGRGSCLLDPDSTGSLAVFAFRPGTEAQSASADVWLCRNQTEEDQIQEAIGIVEPGFPRVWAAAEGAHLLDISATPCDIAAADLPEQWQTEYPSGSEIIAKTIELRPLPDKAVDDRLMRRRECEYSIFKSIETAIETPHIQQGFPNIDLFIARAQTILQRRKARSGGSLELHIKQLLVEEGFQDGQQPDFLFPNVAAYHDPAFPADKLRMLAVKTTCKDRWRQILNEADRIPVKHLLTLQEGVSENQFREMRAANVRLVVPEALHAKYPATVRASLIGLGTYFDEIGTLPLPEGP